jgi:hypothetical protein
MKKRNKNKGDSVSKKQFDNIANLENILESDTPEHTMEEIVIGLYRATLEMMKYAKPGTVEIDFGLSVIRAYNDYNID